MFKIDHKEMEQLPFLSTLSRVCLISLYQIGGQRLSGASNNGCVHNRMRVFRDALVAPYGIGMHSGAGIECHVRMQATRRID